MTHRVGEKKNLLQAQKVDVPDLGATSVPLRSSRCLFEGKKQGKHEENMLAMYHILHKSACINMTPLQLLLLHLK